MKSLGILLLFSSIITCECYNILAIFPYNARSHSIFFSSLMEELARRNHNVTVIDDHPVKKSPMVNQISLQTKENDSDKVDMEEHLKEFGSADIVKVYSTMESFKYAANTNCKKLIENQEVRGLVTSMTHYDLIIVEQFVTDCGFAIAHKLNAPVVGMTAHVLMPWTYSRLGAPSNPAFVPNHFFASGSKPNLFNRIKSAIINFSANIYYRFMIQRSDQLIINEAFPEVPDLESLARNMSLIMLNQYFPLTGSRVYGANVVEVGGMHISQDTKIVDKDLQMFLDTADDGVVYISFGTVASNFPPHIIDKIKKLVERSNLKFIWKVDVEDWVVPKNVFLDKWMPQVAILCHPKVKAFVTHSGMLSTSEAMHCGVPIVGVPLFGDQFANAESAVENGLGVAIDVLSLDDLILENALKTVLQDVYQRRAKELSQIWRNRPLSPMDAAVFWIEYVAGHKGAVNMRPPTVELPTYQYLMVDVLLVIGSILVIALIIVMKVFGLVVKLIFGTKIAKKDKRKKKD